MKLSLMKNIFGIDFATSWLRKINFNYTKGFSPLLMISPLRGLLQVQNISKIFKIK